MSENKTKTKKISTREHIDNGREDFEHAAESVFVFSSSIAPLNKISKNIE